MYGTSLRGVPVIVPVLAVGLLACEYYCVSSLFPR